MEETTPVPDSPLCRETWWQRLRHSASSLFRPHIRELTPLERAQQQDIERLRGVVRAQEEKLREREIDLEIARGRLAVARDGVEALSEVVARDRRRVQAETAEFGRRIAEASGDGQAKP